MDSGEKSENKRACWWCGKDIAGRAQICSECKLPNRLFGSLWTALRLLIIPLTIAAIAYGFSEFSRRSAAELEKRRIEQRAMQQAIIRLGETFNDFRGAGAEMALACRAVDEESCYRNLKKSVTDLDQAFHAIGPQLSFLNAIFDRKGKIDNKYDGLSKTWLNCFIVPYHGDGMNSGPELSYWSRILAVFENDDPNMNGPRLCENNRCRPEAERTISGIVGELFSGTCVCGTPATNRKLTWFLDEVQRLGFNIPSSGTEAAVERWSGIVNEAILNAPGCPNSS